MDYFRVGGVCIAILLIAAALPCGWAQAPQTAGDGSAGGPAPVVSEDFFSKGSGQSEPVSPQSLMKRSSDLKPVMRPGSAGTAAQGTQTAAGQQTATSPAASEPAPAVEETPATPEDASAAAQESQATSESQVEPEVAENPEVPPVTQEVQAPEEVQEAAQEVITPDMIPQEDVTEPAEQTVAVPIVTPPLAEENVTPPEAVITPDNITAENQTVSAEAAENLTEEAVEEEPEVEDTTGNDRIWREGISPDKYTWTPQTFSGFFYDFDDDVGTETLTVSLSRSGSGYDRSIDSGDLEYSSDVQEINYEYGPWGMYEVIGFMADKYFAGYRGTSTELVDEDTSLIDEGELRRVLIDSDSENTITSGSVLSMEEGYELRIKEIDTEGNKVYLALAKDGDEIDSQVISPDGLGSSTYSYEVDIGGRDVPIIMAHISNVFRGVETDLVTVDGIFQISDTFAPVESGDRYGEMEVDELSADRITMSNEDAINLRGGRIVNLFGDVGFQVADTDELRFAPIVERTGTYEVRGTVIDPTEFDEFTWSPYNFEGFFYDIDDDVGTENLTVRITGNKIDDQDLIYETNPRPVQFEFQRWGEYDVIGFMADKYFAGYIEDTEFTDEASIINEGELRKVLIDSDDESTISTGSVLPLEEGYELRIKQVDINGNKVYLALAQNGEEVDSRVVTPSSSAADSESNFLYKVDIGSETEVPIIAAHVQSVFRGTEADLATIDGIFQISDTPESVEEGEAHGKLEVDSLSSDGITMTNDGTITLGQGRTVDIMDNLMFKVADNSERNFAPVSLKTSGGRPLSINISEAVVNRTSRITIRSGNEPVDDAQVFVAGTNIGTTDAAGSIVYTPASAGSLEVVARKTGYGEARSGVEVLSALTAERMAANATAATSLMLNVPSEIKKGENFLITVTGGANQTPMEDVDLFLGNESIGSTNTQGALTYATNLTGEYSIVAVKEGYDNATRQVTVLSPVAISGLEVPETANAGQRVTVTASVQNTGEESDTSTLELRVNDEVVDSREVTLEPGENATQTFTYTPRDPGVYRISLDGQSETINVEESRSNTTLIVLILVLLIAIGAGIYLYKTGELEKLRRQLQGR
jgi:S-layer protein (TIGR01567 family)